MSRAAHSLVRGKGSRAFAMLAVAALLLLAGGFSNLGGLSNSALAVDAGTVTVRLHGCPNGFDGINASLAQLAASCTTPIGGVDFTVQYGNLAPSHQTDLDGSWQFTDVAAGAVTISEFKPDPSYLIRASCAQFDASSGPSGYQEAPVGQGSATWNLGNGQAIDCDWYNFPVAAPTPTPTAATVMVRAHDCPDGFDAAIASFNDLAANCHGTPSGVTFTLTASSGPPRGGQTDGTGFITWQNIAHGAITITEVPPSNRDLFRVFCNQRATAGGELGFSEETVSSASITDTIQDAYDEFDCDWFNAASIQPVTITITKYDCPSGVNAATSTGKLATDCQPFAGVTLTLSGAGGDTAMQTDSSGAATWTGVMPGDYSVQESLPDGYDAPVVLCKIGDPNSAPAQKMDVANAAISFTVASGQPVQCVWYNLPAPPTPTPTDTPAPVVVIQPTATPTVAKLIIETFTCKAGYDVLAKDADPTNDCATPAAGVAFALSGSGNPVKHTTGTNGKATFSNLKPGDFQLAETMPSGVSAAFIGSCDSTARDLSSYPFTPFASIGANGKLRLTLQAGETLDCRWYNVPDKQNATVTITVRQCPGQSAVQSQCTAAGAGIQFTLTPNGAGKALTLTTDDSGVAKSPAAQGTYRLEELGTNWCLADSSAFDENAALVVGSDPVDVAIYNCGA